MKQKLTFLTITTKFFDSQSDCLLLNIIFLHLFELLGTPEGKIGTGVMPAVRLAIKHINKNQDILRGYKLHMYWNDTQVK